MGCRCDFRCIDARATYNPFTDDARRHLDSLCDHHYYVAIAPFVDLDSHKGRVTYGHREMAEISAVVPDFDDPLEEWTQ